MIWIFAIAIILFILLKFIYSLLLDRFDLNNIKLSKKFSHVVEKLNQEAFQGEGHINETGKTEFNLHKKGGNQIIFFIYGTGSLTIIWKVATNFNEIIYKERFSEVRDLSLGDQEILALAVINGMKKLLPANPSSNISKNTNLNLEKPITYAVRAWDGEEILTESKKVWDPTKNLVIMTSVISWNNGVPTQVFEMDIIAINNHRYFYAIDDKSDISINSKLQLIPLNGKDTLDTEVLNDTKNWKVIGNLFLKNNFSAIIPKYFNAFKKDLCIYINKDHESFDLENVSQYELEALNDKGKLNMGICCPLCGLMPMTKKFSWRYKKYWENGVTMNVCEHCFQSRDLFIPQKIHQFALLGHEVHDHNNLQKYNLKGCVKSLNQNFFNIAIDQHGHISKLDLEKSSNYYWAVGNQKSNYIFDLNGLLTQEDIYDFDGSIVYSNYFKYDLDIEGRVILEETCNSHKNRDHSIDKWRKFQYNKYGYVRCISYSDEEYGHDYFDYDKQGNIIHKSLCNGSDCDYDDVDFIYDLKNKDAPKILEFKNDKLDREFEFKKNSASIKLSDGKLDAVITYNDNGDPISSQNSFSEVDIKNGKTSRKYNYEYDNVGNWVKEIVYINDMPKSMRERQFVYH